MTWNRFAYSRKLIGSSIIALALVSYFLSGGRSYLVALGAYFFFEHYLIWERWDFYDFILGHEWWGMYLMFFSLIFYNKTLALLIGLGFAIGATYNKFNPFKSFKLTIMEFLGK